MGAGVGDLSGQRIGDHDDVLAGRRSFDGHELVAVAFVDFLGLIGRHDVSLPVPEPSIN
jgi:hypothetical protein